MKALLTRLTPLIARVLLTVLGRRIARRLELGSLKLRSTIRSPDDRPSDKSER